MRFQIQYKPVDVYGFSLGIGYTPGKAFNLTALLWNRLLIVGWSND